MIYFIHLRILIFVILQMILHPIFVIMALIQSVSGRSKYMYGSSHALCYSCEQLCVIHNSFALYGWDVICDCRAKKAKYWLLDLGIQKDTRIIAKIVIVQIWRSGTFQDRKLKSISYQLLQLIHEKVREQVWTFEKSKIGMNNSLVNIMRTQKGPKVIVKMLLDLLKVQKQYLICQFLQFGANFLVQTLERSRININSYGNLKGSKNNYKNCYYLDLDL